MDAHDRFIGTKEVAELLGIGVTTVKDHRFEFGFEWFRPTPTMRRWVAWRSAVLAYIRERERDARMSVGPL